MLRWTPEAHAEDLHQTKKAKNGIKIDQKNLGNMVSSMMRERGFAHLVPICTSAHSHSSSSTVIQRCAKSPVDARAERETLEREWGEEMSRLVNPICSVIYDVWDRFSSSTWIARSVDGKKWPH